MLSDRSRLGEESLDDGLEENDREEREHACMLPLPSSVEEEEGGNVKIIQMKQFFLKV